MGLAAFDPFGLRRRRRTERSGFEFYGQAVAAARDPHFYQAMAVPDTLDGRFDMVSLFAFLLIRRLTRPDEGNAGATLAQAVFDAMFKDMDINLREMGVGDLSVGKKNRTMWEAFHGRSAAYGEAMMIGPEALAEALERNIWRGGQAPLEAANLARLAYAQDARLARMSLDELSTARPLFLSAREIFA